MMTHNCNPNLTLCNPSIQRIKKLLEKLLFFKNLKTNDSYIHRYNSIKCVSAIFLIRYVNKFVCQEKQRTIDATYCCKKPLDQQMATTQCCVNQKYASALFLLGRKKNQGVLSKRKFKRPFKELLFARKQLNNRATHIPNAKKYQIVVLKKHQEEFFQDNWRTQWMSHKMQERHFLMGHTIKHSV